ncbi:hypothetical protein [Desertibaculum subflavum]|uniref:hypothetical protein n=1 Tax=Desertibaculum subflavum TaxID=2268458 RepID=UPI0034D33774
MLTLHPVFLDRDSLRHAWPLARLARPDLTLDGWVTYGRRHIGRGGTPQRGIIGLSCERGYLYALVVFTRDRQGVLVSEPIAQAALAHAKEPLVMLVDALVGLARMLGCRKLRIETRECPNLASPAQLAALGFIEKDGGFERALVQNGCMSGQSRTGNDAMKLSTIRLELARSHDFPNGSRDRGYEFVAPLMPDGHIDADAFGKSKPQCKVRRFWPGEDERMGSLHRTRNHRWVFSYVPGEEDDESFYRLEQHVFRPGEYVTIHEPDGHDYTFRVASVRPGPAPAS